MTRLAGDPGPWRHVRYALGFRLPADNHDWVWHDLTDAGWRGRILARHLAVMTPVCVVLALLPGEWWIRFLVVVLALGASTFVVAISAGDLRASRLHQHGMPDDFARRSHPDE
ncbi:MAG: hypothetical protein JWN52_4818 [Actinomycetia bacterium]|nr:hypothetical protein [Actinomycetes bacterium]